MAVINLAQEVPGAYVFFFFFTRIKHIIIYTYKYPGGNFESDNLLFLKLKVCPINQMMPSNG